MRSIETDADHEAALKEIERLWEAPQGTADGDLLESLTVMVEAYEDTHFPMAAPDPSSFALS